MYVALFCLIGIVALAAISAQAWRDRARVAASVTPDWHDTLRRLATEQELGHYRSAREKTVSVLRRLESRRFDPRMAAHVRVRIASLMARDPVYTEVVRAIRKACAAQTSISEMALCVGLRQFLIEDIRISMEIAEMLGQVRRAEEGGSPTVMAEFHPTA
ncbi:MAG TPA: hypothetical protein PLN96_06295 [Zoogloea sp.]|uniref:hypothetical protein n=1 Tax=Zoogloea sp. TaxID=49181 RepID=UPI002C7211C2|nr:hypothetical protein [Zoogloea sp.]HMV16470.1 hypothetical protein [Rhodocyclaceae bacterium]HMV62844.1 hypothetical protein [Rhodocyclaceae bacterium]HMW50856.1 hypothetical protein [Rhodocyclaceae bacterium]HMY48327.1 hypothetical protein [Rhodocyclaceae bacterium]HMZ75290.1 hypothetical protein [Rhodocyclaceae bacterium]